MYYIIIMFPLSAPFLKHLLMIIDDWIKWTSDKTAFPQDVDLRFDSKWLFLLISVSHYTIDT